MFHQSSTKLTSTTMSTNPRFVSNRFREAVFMEAQIINRSIRANRNMMRWSELLLDLHQDMQCLARYWLFVHGTA
jgi:hypothetical protein